MSEIITIYEFKVHKSVPTFNDYLYKLMESEKKEMLERNDSKNTEDNERRLLRELANMKDSFLWFQRVNSVKEKLLSIKIEYNKILDEIDFARCLLGLIEKSDFNNSFKDQKHFFSRINLKNLENKLKELEQPLLLIFTRYEAHVIQNDLYFNQSKVAQIIFDIIEEEIEDNSEEIYLRDFLTQSNIDLLKYLNVPLFDKVEKYNDSVRTRIQAELLSQYWDVTYKVIFNIPNAKSAIKNDEVLQNNSNLKVFQVKKDSVEIIKQSDEDIDGHDVHPHSSQFKMDLMSHLRKMTVSSIERLNEDEVLQRILNLCAADFDIELINHSFPDSYDIDKL